MYGGADRKRWYFEEVNRRIKVADWKSAATRVQYQRPDASALSGLSPMHTDRRLLEDPIAWRDAVSAAAHDFGFATILDLMRAFPREPVGKLYRLTCRTSDPESRVDVGFARFQDAIFSEAIATGQMHWVARDLLARAICEHVGGGWGRGRNPKSRQSKAWAAWLTPWKDDRDFDVQNDRRSRTWNALIELAPAPDWCPTGPDDPIIVSAFEKTWPE
jgi:hypothetical protein